MAASLSVRRRYSASKARTTASRTTASRARVEELMALVDGLEAQLAPARDTGARLLDAVVAELTRPHPVAP